MVPEQQGRGGGLRRSTPALEALEAGGDGRPGIGSSDRGGVVGHRPQQAVPLRRLHAQGPMRLRGDPPLLYGDRGVRRGAEDPARRQSVIEHTEEDEAARAGGPLRLPGRPVQNLCLDARGFAGFPRLEDPSGGAGPGGLPAGAGRKSVLRVLEEALHLGGSPADRDAAAAAAGAAAHLVEGRAAAGRDPRRAAGFAGLPLGGGQEPALGAVRPFGHLQGASALPNGVRQGFMDIYRVGRGGSHEDGIKDLPMTRLVAREEVRSRR